MGGMEEMGVMGVVMGGMGAGVMMVGVEVIFK